MNLENYKNLFKSNLDSLYEKVTESALYNICLEKYENLDTSRQKWIRFSLFSGCLLCIFYIPASSFLTSLKTARDFKTKKNLIFSLLQKDSQTAFSELSPSQFESRISAIVSQFKTAQESPKITTLPRSIQLEPSLKKLKYSGKKITIKNINVKTVLDIGLRLDQISPSVKLMKLTMTESKTEKNYFTAVFSLVHFQAPKTLKKITPVRPSPRFKNRPSIKKS